MIVPVAIVTLGPGPLVRDRELHYSAMKNGNICIFIKLCITLVLNSQA